jgi:hypothetical protein
MYAAKRNATWMSDINRSKYNTRDEEKRRKIECWVCKNGVVVDGLVGKTADAVQVAYN